MMEKALVLGASGGMGYSIVKELVKRKVKVVAFARSKEKLNSMFGEEHNVLIHPGDAFYLEDLEIAARDVDVIFHAINLPYGDWAEKLPMITKNIIATAKKYTLKLAIVDNIYAYGKSIDKAMDETTPKNPNTKKGKIRLEMEELIKNSGVPYIMVHFPDFYGPYAENAQLNYMLRQIAKNKKAGFIGSRAIPREHIYTPDGAKAIVELALHEGAVNQSWNVPAYDVINGEEIIKIVRGITGYEKSVFTVSKHMIRFLGLFNKQMREFAEMQYLNEDPVVLSGEKYEQLIGPVPRTPYDEGIRKTLKVYKQMNNGTLKILRRKK